MQRQKGFSLIELLIVLAIILIIAAIAIPNLLRARAEADFRELLPEQTIPTTPGNCSAEQKASLRARVNAYKATAAADKNELSEKNLSRALFATQALCGVDFSK